MKDVSQIDRYESAHSTLVYLRDDIFNTIRQNIPSGNYGEENCFDVVRDYIDFAIVTLEDSMEAHTTGYEEKLKNILYKLDLGHHPHPEEIELLKRAVITSS